MPAPLLAIVPGVVSFLGGIIDMLSGNEKAKAEALLLELKGAQDQVLAQIDVNKEEAKSSSLFVSGWRPAVGWMCGLGVGYNVLIWPILSWISENAGLISPPQIDMMFFGELLFGLLGISGMRSWEKYKGIAR